MCSYPTLKTNTSVNSLSFSSLLGIKSHGGALKIKNGVSSQEIEKGKIKRKFADDSSFLADKLLGKGLAGLIIKYHH